MFENKSHLIYEQPLNELVRVSLRIEYLFQQINEQLQILPQTKTTRILMRWLIELLALIDRPDLKPKLTKEFHRLIKLISKKDPDTASLVPLVPTLSNLATGYLSDPGRAIDELKQNRFLNDLRQTLSLPSGDSPADAPFYFFWLNQPIELQSDQIKIWLQTIESLKNTIDLFLTLIRKIGRKKTIVTKSGFHIEPFESRNPLQLIRVILNRADSVYPDISAGKHRASLRLISIDPDHCMVQTDQDLEIQIILCII